MKRIYDTCCYAGIEVGCLDHPVGMKLTMKEVEEQCTNALGVRVESVVSRAGMFNFSGFFKPITIWKNSKQSVGYDEWLPIEPNPDLVNRFEQSSRFLGLLRIFIEHMEFCYKIKSEVKPLHCSKVYLDGETCGSTHCNS